MSETNQEESKLKTLPWYKDGLRFKCTECGKCCTGSPGYVWVSEEEMEAISNLLKMTVSDFKRKYTRQKNNRYALLEKKYYHNDCIFLDGKKCKIYEARPKQCRTFPWWQENLNSKESWELAAQSCEGISDQAPIVPYEEICRQLNLKNEVN